VSKSIRASVSADVFEDDGKRSAAHAQCFSFLQACTFATTQTVRPLFCHVSKFGEKILNRQAAQEGA